MLPSYFPGAGCVLGAGGTASLLDGWITIVLRPAPGLLSPVGVFFTAKNSLRLS
jgi:hypothetical protein